MRISNKPQSDHNKYPKYSVTIVILKDKALSRFHFLKLSLQKYEFPWKSIITFTQKLIN